MKGRKRGVKKYMNLFKRSSRMKGGAKVLHALKPFI
jgi:hypothetical protein